MLRAVSVSTKLLKNCNNSLIKPSCLQIVRNKSYYDSDLEGPPQIYTDFEKSYTEWKWVERLIPPQTVPPAPSQPGKEFPSGWKVPDPPKNCPYYIPRNKNHMMPVYLLIWDRGQLRETRIRHVEGDIWALERDVGKYLKTLFPEKTLIRTYTQECYRFVGIKGDYSEEIKEWLLKRGF